MYCSRKATCSNKDGEWERCESDIGKRFFFRRPPAFQGNWSVCLYLPVVRVCGCFRRLISLPDFRSGIGRRKRTNAIEDGYLVVVGCKCDGDISYRSTTSNKRMELFQLNINANESDENERKDIKNEIIRSGAGL